jgi:hypothetical protein
VAVVTHVPDLHRLTGGRFEETCSKCLRSDFVPAVDADDAWGEMLRLGWSLYTSEVMAPTARHAGGPPLCHGGDRPIWGEELFEFLDAIGRPTPDR